VKRAVVALVAIAVLAALGIRIFRQKEAAAREVIVLCGGSMRAALEEVIEHYKAVSSDTVVATFGGSGVLCAQIQKTGKGDIFICHDPFMEWAEQQGLVHQWDTVGLFKVVIAVARGNPKGVNGLGDLAKPGLRVGIGDTTYSTSGVIAKSIQGPPETPQRHRHGPH
jgi:molybdate transport system substrate-binding protein